MKTLDIVFQGGGARGLALNGALAALERSGHAPGRVVGTSAGAITAALVASGYSGEELWATSLELGPTGASRMTEFIGHPQGFDDSELLGSSLAGLLSEVEIPLVPEAFEHRAELWLLRRLLAVRPFASLFSLVERGGYFSADGFLAWLTEKLDAGGRDMSRLSLAELFARTGRHLSVVVSDTHAGTMRVLNHLTTPHCPVLWAVRMSMSIPFFWPEVRWRAEWGTYLGESLTDHAIVDGGVVSNFPLRLIVSPEPWIEAIMGEPADPDQIVLGLSLDDRLPVPGGTSARPITEHVGTSKLHDQLLGRVERLANTVLDGNDRAEVSQHPDLVCHLPVMGYGVVEFHMSPARIEALLDAGGAALEAWLDRHDAPKTVAHAQSRVRAPSP